MYDMSVGSHSGAMYQVAFAPDQYAIFILWPMLNRGGLTTFLRPKLVDESTSRTDHAIWMSAILELDSSVLEKDSYD